MADIGLTEAARITAHMNAEHSASLGHYLELASVPRKRAYENPQISSFTSEAMVIQYGPEGQRKSHEHRFEPPMRAGEARGRLVKMHEEAREKLGLSDVHFRTLTVSTSALFSCALLLAFELWLATLPASRAGSLFWWHAPVFNPLLRLAGFAATKENLGAAVKGWWLFVIFAAHVYEVPTCLWPTMRRYNVDSWWQRRVYELLTVMGGFPVWTSMRSIGREEEAKLAKEKKAH
ncbi:hypothetical protein JCM10213_001834 [Rhodosporidiobolus nylandii]